MKVKVKICGVRTLHAAKVAVDGSADFLGFNFVPSSKRYIKPIDAKKIIDRIRGKAKIVGVFQDSSLEEVSDITGELALDYVQLHGRESEDYCREVEAPVIKAFQLPANFSVQNTLGTMACYSVPLYLIDREKRGEGEIIDLKKSRKLANKVPLFFSGGLTPENVSDIIRTIRPFAVDVTGGIETDGRQDIEKIKTFIERAKDV